MIFKSFNAMIANVYESNIKFFMGILGNRALENHKLLLSGGYMNTS